MIGRSVTNASVRTDGPLDEGVLAHVWHPVARLADLGEETDIDAGPLAVELLGHRLVIARLHGELVAFDDRCAHRGAALSLGRTDGGCLECPYHGWRYRSDGACTTAPALPVGRRVPSTARVAARACTARAGLVWVCLDVPHWPLPDLPETDAGWRTIVGDPYEWDCDPSRRIENFLDFAHFAFVHDGLLGRRTEPEVPHHDIEVLEHEIRIHQVRTEPAEGGVKPADSSTFTTDVRYRVFPPYAAVLDQRMPGGERFVLSIASAPVAGHRSRTFWVLSRDYDVDGSDEPYVRFQKAINEQDRPVIESLDPPWVTPGSSDEIHLRDVDAVAIAYRRALGAIGVDP